MFLFIQGFDEMRHCQHHIICRVNRKNIKEDDICAVSFVFIPGVLNIFVNTYDGNLRVIQNLYSNQKVDLIEKERKRYLGSNRAVSSHP